MILNDIKNGFPSPAHRKLDAFAHRHAHAHDATLLIQRHRQAEVLMEGHGGEQVLLRTGCGNAQGDEIAAERLEELRAETRDIFKGMRFV